MNKVDLEVYILAIHCNTQMVLSMVACALHMMQQLCVGANIFQCITELMIKRYRVIQMGIPVLVFLQTYV